MLNRIRNYQKYYWKTIQTNKASAESSVMFIVLFFVTITVGTTGAVQMNIVDLTTLCALLGMFSQYYDDVNNRMLRQVPVSDKFAVFNLIVITPLCFMIVTGLFLLLLATVGIGSIMLMVGDTSTMGMAYGGTIVDFIKDWLINILLLLIRWSIFVLISFYRERVKKIGIFIAYLVLYLTSNWWLVQTLREYKYFGQYTYYEIVQLLPFGQWIVIGLIFTAVVLWIYTWKTCLTLYRADIKGQKRTKSLKIQEVPAQQKSSWVAVSVLMVILVAFFIGIMIATFSNPDGKACDIVIDDSQNYYELSVYADEQGINSEVYFLDSNQTIFPESVDGIEVEQYYASIRGKHGDGWSSLAWERLLVATYTENEYKNEKERVSMLSITHDSQTNKIVKDTEHFATEAYIAIYDEEYGLYEYALFDDENRQVAYVFLQDSSPNEIDTDTDITFKGNSSKIVPIKKSNTRTKGYSIYSFWDNEERYYETWWPGKDK